MTTMLLALTAFVIVTDLPELVGKAYACRIATGTSTVERDAETNLIKPRELVASELTTIGYRFMFTGPRNNITAKVSLLPSSRDWLGIVGDRKLSVRQYPDLGRNYRVCKGPSAFCDVALTLSPSGRSMSMVISKLPKEYLSQGLFMVSGECKRVKAS